MTASPRNSPRTPWLAVTLLGAVAGVCVALGIWQMDRFAETRALVRRYAAAESQPATARSLEDLAAMGTGAARYRSIEVTGRFVPDRQFLLDNVVRQGVPGYYVLTPFRRDDSSPGLLVNRGWVRADPNRSVLPDVAVSAAPRRISGRLDTLPAPGLRLGAPGASGRGDDPVIVLLYPTVAELEAALGYPLFEYQLLLAPEHAEGFAREWRGPAVAPMRHAAYAGQWWLFAAVAGIAAVALAWRALPRSEG